ncbi:glycosyltransferase family 1 protein [Thermodesulfobacteriota bacterium]
MNVLMISENDPAGMGIAFTNAINKHTDYRCRLITTKSRYNFNFEKDLHIPDLGDEDFEEICELLKSADIIHFHILSDENMELGPIKVKDYINGKVVIHHHHGHPEFRAHPEKYREKYRRLRRSVLVSTPDLLKLLPEARWQPNLVPIDDPLYLPEHVRLNGALVIGQSATRKDLKNTEDLLEVAAKIQKECNAPKVLLDIIENTDYRECLRRKNRCHIIFDHMQGYYGVSSLESLSQGKPVIAGLDDWNLDHIKKFTEKSSLPWIICRTKDELKKTLYVLTQDRERIQNLGQESRKFICRHWSDKKTINTLIDFYHSL